MSELILRVNALATGTVRSPAMTDGKLLQDEPNRIGKDCPTRCVIYHTTGGCRMPRNGLFALVLEGSALHPGLPVEVVHKVPRRKGEDRHVEF